MLKMALLDYAIKEKCCSVDGGRGICPLSSLPRGIWQLKSPHPREFAIQSKNNANARGSARGGGRGAGGSWNWLMRNEYDRVASGVRKSVMHAALILPWKNISPDSWLAPLYLLRKINLKLYYLSKSSKNGFAFGNIQIFVLQKVFKFSMTKAPCNISFGTHNASWRFNRWLNFTKYFMT